MVQKFETLHIETLLPNLALYGGTVVDAKFIASKPMCFRY